MFARVMLMVAACAVTALSAPASTERRERRAHACVRSVVERAFLARHRIVSDDDDADPLLVLPAPIEVPPLADRTHELNRIVDKYASEAIADLKARGACFTPVDRGWILEHATSLTEIEKATVRVVVRMSRNLSEAAERLDMAPVSLWR